MASQPGIIVEVVTFHLPQAISHLLPQVLGSSARGVPDSVRHPIERDIRRVSDGIPSPRAPLMSPRPVDPSPPTVTKGSAAPLQARYRPVVVARLKTEPSACSSAATATASGQQFHLRSSAFQPVLTGTGCTAEVDAFLARHRVCAQLHDQVARHGTEGFVHRSHRDIDYMAGYLFTHFFEDALYGDTGHLSGGQPS
ncbi:hypothetical protein ADK86_36805 [Streptomyces sp. NRRL F-5755]|nr:hypothetical protein ADK86_36805 [Streptomyces sp. NRRL F-5755]